MKELTNGEKQFIMFMGGMTGGFYTHLFEAMMRADPWNRAKLMKAFPEEMEACYRYHNEPGYAETLGLA